MIGIKKLTVALALGLASSSVLALGLGQIKVTSGLNEPLRAEIPVLSSSAAELRGLTVALASADDFTRVGLSLAQLDVPLKFTVVKKHGDTVIEITTKEPVADPALDFLVEVNWANGKLLREYTILLDPPNMAPVVTTTPSAPAAPAVITTPEPPRHADDAVAKETTPLAPAAQTSTTTKTMPAAPAKPAVVAETPPLAPAHSGAIRVSKGDTLWDIAESTHADAGVGTNEMMLALLRANPDAFYKDNINALKSGAVLRMPSRDEVAKLSSGAARAAVRQQNQHWASIRPQAPVMLAKTGSTTSSSADRDNDSRSTSERLALVPPSSGGNDVASDPGVAGGTGNARITGLKQELANAKTALTSAKQQSNDLHGRVQDLEGINSKNSHLISLKDAEIAELQRKLAVAQSVASAASAVSGSKAEPAAAASVQSDIFNANAPATDATNALADVTATPASGATTALAPVSASSAMSDTSTPVAESSAEAPATAAPVAAATVSTPAPVTEMPEANTSAASETGAAPWYMQDWLKYLVGLVILLLIVFGFMKSRGGKKTAPMLAADGDPSVAYQGDVDEENALLNEIQQRPDDLASHMELASLYYAQRDQDKFEAAAEAMHPHVVDPDCEEWQQVRAMGEELCPDSPLFASMDSDGEYPVVPVPGVVHDDETIGTPATDAERTAAADDGYSFDFNLTPGTTGASKSGATDAPHDANDDMPAAAADLDVDRDSADDDLGFGIASDASADAADPASDATVSSDDYEIDEETVHGSFSSDPVDTKLDLARAYQDMGDAEGARAMLDEVLAEGSEAQKDIARKLIDELE